MQDCSDERQNTKATKRFCAVLDGRAVAVPAEAAWWAEDAAGPGSWSWDGRGAVDVPEPRRGRKTEAHRFAVAAPTQPAAQPALALATAVVAAADLAAADLAVASASDDCPPPGVGGPKRKRAVRRRERGLLCLPLM